MAGNLNQPLASPHITEASPQAYRQMDGYTRDRINLSLGYLVKTGEFPSDQLYDRVVEVAYKSTHDPLTGLLNRAGFEQAYDRKLTISENDKKARWAFIFVDLDGFKNVNDTKGHDVGDKLLTGLASEWATSTKLRQNDILGRIGGDEFVVLADISPQGNDNRHELPPEEATAGVINHLRRDAQSVIDSSHIDFGGLSAGYAIIKDGMSYKEAKHAADLNMYKNKKERKAAP